MPKQVEPTIAQPQKISDIKLSDGSLGGYGGLMKKAYMMLAPKKPIAPRMPPATLPSRILGLIRLSSLLTVKAISINANARFVSLRTNMIMRAAMMSALDKIICLLPYFIIV